MINKVDVEEAAQLLAYQVVEVPQIKNWEAWRHWKSTILPKIYPTEYKWFSQFGANTRDALYDVLEEFLPSPFKLSNRQQNKSPEFAAEFMLVVLEIIRKKMLYETCLVIQRIPKQPENLMLMRPIIGELIGKPVIQVGRE